MCCCIHGSSG
jgi:hypothetical protein